MFIPDQLFMAILETYVNNKIILSYLRNDEATQYIGYRA